MCVKELSKWMMARIKRGNYIFVSYIGDHPPRHVHIYRDKKLICKWDLENDVPMEGRANGKLRDLIAEMKKEGVL